MTRKTYGTETYGGVPDAAPGVIKVRPIYSTIYTPDQLLAFWQLMAKDCERVLAHGDNDEDMDSVFNEIMAGRILLWIIFVDEKYAGYLTTAIRTTTTRPVQRWLWISHLSKKLGVQADIRAAAMSAMIEHAITERCSEIRFYSTRAMEKWTKDFGFRPSYTEYKYTVQGGK